MGLFSKKKRAAPAAPAAPDYTAITNAMAESAKMSFALTMEQMDWARKTYADDRAIQQQVTDAALETQDLNNAAALADRLRYQETYQPLEDAAVEEAKSYASPERMAMEMGRAESSVAQEFDAQRKAAAQNLEAFGVDPSSTRYAALDRGARIQQAAAQAGAGNQARAQTEATGRALRSEAINTGRGYPGQIAGAYGSSGQAGNSAINSTLATTASGANTMGTSNQWQNTGNNALGQWGNMTTAAYGNEINAYNAQQNAYNNQQNSSSGLGGLIGSVLGAAGPGGALAGFLAEGGAVGDVTSGGNVPASASPTGGAAIDDVDARLTAGEFVIPKDAVSWFGEKHFQQLIEKARKERPQAGAKPTYAIVPDKAPTFTSDPIGAIPG